MKENIMNFVLRLRTAIYVIGFAVVILSCIYHFAFGSPTIQDYLTVEDDEIEEIIDVPSDKCFWPPDMIPHPHPPQPQPTDPKDRIV